MDSGHNKTKCIAQTAYEAFNKNEITRDEMEKLVALDIAETLHDFPIRPYSNPSEKLSNYILSRSCGLLDKDKDLAIKTGEWSQMVRQVLTLNKIDLETIVWAANICLSLNANEKVNKISKHIEKYKNNKFPVELYLQSLAAQKLDSEETQRKLPRLE